MPPIGNRTLLTVTMKILNICGSKIAATPNIQANNPTIIAALAREQELHFSYINNTKGSASDIDEVNAAKNSNKKNKNPKGMPKGIWEKAIGNT